jgi:methionine-rich copper-binding protein CopC
MPGLRTTGAVALAIAGIVTLSGAAVSPRTMSSRRHARLIKSEPTANDTLTAPPRALRLWFSEKVELPVASVKLVDGSGAAMSLAPLARPDTGDAAPIVVAITKPLAAGTYAVHWTVAAKDGHPAKGTFEFLVKAGR